MIQTTRLSKRLGSRIALDSLNLRSSAGGPASRGKRLTAVAFDAPPRFKTTEISSGEKSWRIAMSVVALFFVAAAFAGTDFARLGRSGRLP